MQKYLGGKSLVNKCKTTEILFPVLDYFVQSELNKTLSAIITQTFPERSLHVTKLMCLYINTAYFRHGI